MKNFKPILFAFLVLALLAPASFAQTATTRTALTVALPSGSGSTSLTVASSTGMTASTASAPTWLAICDGPTLPPSTSACEVMRLDTVNSATTVTVRRAQSGGSGPRAHPSGSRVWYGRTGTLAANGNTAGVFLTTTPAGACTRSAAGASFLPVINTSTGEVSDCLPNTTGTGHLWVSYNLYPRGPSYPHKTLAVTESTYTTTAVNMIVGVNTAVASTITLAACTGCEGAWFWIVDELGGTANAPATITVAGSVGQLVNGGASTTLVPSATPFAGAWIYNNGTNWVLVRTRNQLP